MDATQEAQALHGPVRRPQRVLQDAQHAQPTRLGLRPRKHMLSVPRGDARRQAPAMAPARVLAWPLWVSSACARAATRNTANIETTWICRGIEVRGGGVFWTSLHAYWG